MAETMCMGTLKASRLAIPVALAALALSACGSGDQATSTQQPPPLAAATADRLAKLSERVASEIDAGNTCHAAHSADDLAAEVEDSDLPATLRPGVEEVSGRLVDEVNCPPPPPPPEPKEEKKKEEHRGDEDNSGPGHSGGLPPGKAKLKGEG
jgi:hypothetical protein